MYETLYIMVPQMILTVISKRHRAGGDCLPALATLIANKEK